MASQKGVFRTGHAGRQAILDCLEGAAGIPAVDRPAVADGERLWGPCRIVKWLLSLSFSLDSVCPGPVLVN